MVDYCAKYKLFHLILFWDITTNIKCKKNIGIITQIWHRVKEYFTCIGNTWYLITVQNMNKITHSSLIYHKNTHIWKTFCTESNLFSSNVSAAHGTWSWYSIWKWKNPCSHHRGICEDGLTVGLMYGLTHWTLSCIPQFQLGRVGN